MQTKWNNCYNSITGVLKLRHKKGGKGVKTTEKHFGNQWFSGFEVLPQQWLLHSK